MLEKITEETKKATKLLDESGTTSLQSKALLKQLTAEIAMAIEDGDWSLACKLSYYRHELAKLSGNHDWYAAFLEIRKIKDTLELFQDKKKLPG